MKGVRLIHTDSTHPEFVSLVKLLDAELAERDGAEHAFYAQFNGITALNEVVLAYIGDQAVGCGAVKAFDDQSMEVKRMYVLPDFRGIGVASRVLSALESRAHSLGYRKCVLETGLRQPEAIALYSRRGYTPIPNYGQYQGIENSRCFERRIDVPLNSE